MGDLVAAFRTIVRSGATYVVNDCDGLNYLGEILWHAAGRPDRAGRDVDQGLRGQAVIDATVEKGGYMLWGLTPFRRTRQAGPADLEPLLLKDPLLQRIMASIVVRPEKVPGVNPAAATAFQDYPLSPATTRRRTCRDRDGRPGQS